MIIISTLLHFCKISLQYQSALNLLFYYLESCRFLHEEMKLSASDFSNVNKVKGDMQCSVVKYFNVIFYVRHILE